MLMYFLSTVVCQSLLICPHRVIYPEISSAVELISRNQNIMEHQATHCGCGALYECAGVLLVYVCVCFIELHPLQRSLRERASASKASLRD